MDFLLPPSTLLKTPCNAGHAQCRSPDPQLHPQMSSGGDGDDLLGGVCCHSGAWEQCRVHLAWVVLYLPFPSVHANDQLLLAPGSGGEEGKKVRLPPPPPIYSEVLACFPSSSLEESLSCLLQPRLDLAGVRW